MRGQNSGSVACSMQWAITLVAMWLPWPSMIRRRRDSVSSDLVSGSKTVVSHSCRWLSEVQPLLLVEDRQLQDLRAGIRTVLVCCTLKMIRGGIATPAALTNSIAVI
jgi:hypothetical protein